MQNYENRNKGVQLRSSKVSLNAVDVNYAFYASFSDHNSAPKDVKNVCVPAMAAADLQFCEAVLISEFTETNDFSVVVTTNIVLEPHEFVFRTVKDGETKVHVCIGTLRRKLPHNRAGVSQFQAFTHEGCHGLVHALSILVTFIIVTVLKT